MIQSTATGKTELMPSGSKQGAVATLTFSSWLGLPVHRRHSSAADQPHRDDTAAGSYLCAQAAMCLHQQRMIQLLKLLTDQIGQVDRLVNVTLKSYFKETAPFKLT